MTASPALVERFRAQVLAGLAERRQASHFNGHAPLAGPTRRRSGEP